ncbi:uncharacterized protein N7529_007564 [Penicillium soppii]|uniref:uncharacterized protein n=1 Tax=Penicillium soppii TaxID=69789 RepID=UPI00254736FF|nr:uncharacterized protein N7529_007564 [Penicillium soppii]KAJ5860254.1 hypothetical protein N7529_007564 [Penicillium soppii]
MSYPQPPAQRAPPLRQYTNAPSPSVTSPGGYSQDGSYAGYSDGGMSGHNYPTDPSYDDVSSPTLRVRSTTVPRSLNRARCAHLDLQALQALDMDALQMVILQVGDRRNRGQEHLVDALPQAAVSTIPFHLSPTETQETQETQETHELQGTPETRETREAVGIQEIQETQGTQETPEDCRETRGIVAVRHRAN